MRTDVEAVYIDDLKYVQTFLLLPKICAELHTSAFLKYLIVCLQLFFFCICSESRAERLSTSIVNISHSFSKH